MFSQDYNDSNDVLLFLHKICCRNNISKIFSKKSMFFASNGFQVKISWMTLMQLTFETPLRPFLFKTSCEEK